LLGEESYSGGKYNLTDDPTWIVDRNQYLLLFYLLFYLFVFFFF